jgi:hypothetical protein
VSALTQISAGLHVKLSNRTVKQFSCYGTIQFGQTGFEYELTTTPAVSLTFAQLPSTYLSTAEIAALFLPKGVHLPEEIPDLQFQDTRITFTPSTGYLQVHATCTAKWTLDWGLDESNFLIHSVEFQVIRNPSDHTTGITLDLHGNPVTLFDELTFRQYDLSFHLEEKRVGQESHFEWKLTGEAELRFFDQNYQIEVTLEQTDEQRIFAFTGKKLSQEPLIDLAGLGVIDASSMSIRAVKRLRTVAGHPSFEWSVEAEGHLRLDVITPLDVSGTIALTERSFVFRPKDTEIQLPIPAEYHEELSFAASAAFHLGVSSLALYREGGKGIRLSAEVKLWTSGIPASLPAMMRNALSEPTSVILEASDKRLSIQGRMNWSGSVTIPNPGIAFGEQESADLGQFAFGLSGIKLTVEKSQFQIALELGIGLPESINALFGTNEDGTPKTKVFRTYVDHQPDSLISFEAGLQFGKSLGMYVMPKTSLFEAIPFTSDGTDTWCEWKLGPDGENGQLSFKIPRFRFDGTSIAASGAFKIAKPLKIPLKSIKNSLRARGLDQLGAILPDAVPLQSIDLLALDDDILEVVKQLAHVTGLQLPDNVLHAIAEVVNKLNELEEDLPDDFKKYLTITLPESLSFDLRITADGGVRFKLSVDEDGTVPIRFLIPNATGLIGIELYSITFGEAFVGALFLLQDFHIVIDQFDFVNLALSLVMPDEFKEILGDPRHYRNQVTIDNLFMLIILQTRIPILLPLFVDDFHFEYTGFEGIDARFGIQFPKPSFEMKEALTLLREFKDFIAKDDALLDVDNPPRKMNLRLTLGPDRLKLPKYMGGQQLDVMATFDLYQSAAYMLNALKKQSIVYLIQAIPIECRVGSSAVHFAGMGLEVEWLLTSPEEFQKIGYLHLNVRPDQVTHLIGMLPKLHDVKENEEGVVLFLKGVWELPQIAFLDTYFGLVAKHNQFYTALRIAGSINHVIDVLIQGELHIDQKAKFPVALSGETSLSIADREILSGKVKLTDQQFEFEGHLDLFPGSTILRITADAAGMINARGFYARGQSSIVIMNYLTLSAASFELTHTSIRFAGTWLNQTVRFESVLSEQRYQFHAAMSPFTIGSWVEITGAKQNPSPIAYLAIDRRNDSVELYLTGRATLFGISAETIIHVKPTGYEFELQGQLFHMFEAIIHAAASKANELHLSDFTVDVSLRQNFSEFMRDTTRRLIDVVIGSLNGELMHARRKREDASREVERLNEVIESTKAQIRRDKSNVEQKLQHARNDVDAKRNEVNHLNYLIADKKRQFDILHWYEAPIWGPIYLAEIAGLGVALVTAQAALGIAIGVLDAAAALSRGYDVESDPRVLSLKVARDSAMLVLHAAEQFLQLIQSTFHGVQQAMDYITDAASALLIVRSASFSTQLSSTQGNLFAVNLEIEYLGRVRSMTFDFDFSNPEQSVKNLLEVLVKG